MSLSGFGITRDLEARDGHGRRTSVGPKEAAASVAECYVGSQEVACRTRLLLSSSKDLDPATDLLWPLLQAVCRVLCTANCPYSGEPIRKKIRYLARGWYVTQGVRELEAF